jgi:hypothetical protein
MSLKKRIQKLEQKVLPENQVILVIYEPDWDNPNYVIKTCNGERTRLTLFEFKQQEKEAKKRRNRWIVIGDDI